MVVLRTRFNACCVSSDMRQKVLMSASVVNIRSRRRTPLFGPSALGRKADAEKGRMFDPHYVLELMEDPVADRDPDVFRASG